MSKMETYHQTMSLHGFSILFLDCCAVNPVTGTTNDFDNTAWCTTSAPARRLLQRSPKPAALG